MGKGFLSARDNRNFRVSESTVTRKSQTPLGIEYIFMQGNTGNYYYCFACQAACPVGRAIR
jgi:hypothetical protein